MRRLLTVVMTFALAAAVAAQQADWPDARTGRIIDRYVSILSRRPVEGTVFRNLASVYDLAGKLDELDSKLTDLVGKNPKKTWPLLLRGHLERYHGRADGSRRFYAGAVAHHSR